MTSEYSVLIVDDDEDIRMNTRDILEDLGYLADTAADGPTALQLISERSYDVALVDFKMRGMDGATLYREIRRTHPEIVAIMITAYAGGNGAQQALDAGIWKVLRKPVDFPQLLNMIDQIVHEPVVLVLDDDREFCATLWQILREHGYRVNLAHGEEEGILKASTGQVDVAIIDIRLGNSDCRNVYQRVHENHPHARTLMVTGFREQAEDVMQELSNGGPDGICFKPIEMPELLQTLRQLCPEGA